MEIAAAEWEKLRRLAGRSGVSADRIAALQKRLDPARARPGAPYTLVAGRPDGGLEVLLSRWVAPAAAKALLQAGERPLVLGPDPTPLCPRIGGWNTFPIPQAGVPACPWAPTGDAPPGHWIAVRIPIPPEVDLIAQLGTLGYLEQLVIVTRLGQPLHQIEREFARTFSGLCATVRVLIVALPSEDASANDVAELSAYAAAQMRDQGVSLGRYLGAGVWRSEPKPEDVGTITDLARFLAIDQERSRAHRDGLFQHALRDALQEIEEGAKQLSEPQRSLPEIPSEEQDRFARELRTYLADLGRQLRRSLTGPQQFSDDSVRQAARDAFRGWGAGVTIEGFWLKHLEQLRPGFREAFFAAADASLLELGYDPPRGTASMAAAVEAGADRDSDASSVADAADAASRGELGRAARGMAQAAPGILDWAVLEAKRWGAALVGAVLCYGAVLLSMTEGVRWLRGGAAASGSGGWLETIGGGIGFFVGLLLSYSAACKFFPAPGRRSRASGGSTLPPPPVGTLVGWERLESRLSEWFAERMKERSQTVTEECQALARTLGLEESVA